MTNWSTEQGQALKCTGVEGLNKENKVRLITNQPQIQKTKDSEEQVRLIKKF